MIESSSDILLRVDALDVSFHQGQTETKAVRDVSFALRKGQCLGIVGESGSGKSVTSLSILNLLRMGSNNETNGRVEFFSGDKEVELLSAPESKLYKIRGRKISMVFQEPMSALNPVRRCGHQVREMLEIHDIGAKESHKERVIQAFAEVSLPDPERVYRSYPHELSGGQLQRVNIAMALIAEPEIVICDEPTTALDVTVQKDILELLRDLTSRNRTAMIFISHDLDVVASLCDSAIVMYQGQIVEKGPLPELFQNAKHPYTRALVACKPNALDRHLVLPTVQEILNNSHEEKSRGLSEIILGDSLLEVSNLNVSFPIPKTTFFGEQKYLQAVKDVSFHLKEKQILGIVGESGSGKSTVANCIAGLIAPSSGSITYGNLILTPSNYAGDKSLRTAIQLVFQDPYSSLNPRMTIGSAIKEPLRFHKIRLKDKIDERVNELLSIVGLDETYGSRYPHQLSGGQRQRACIARALSVEPKILICDESVSALDVSVQAQILNLLDTLRKDQGLSIIFISHDLSVIHYLCDYVLVMKDGHLVEEGVAADVLNHPKKSYTQNLVNSLPTSF